MHILFRHEIAPYILRQLIIHIVNFVNFWILLIKFTTEMKFIKFEHHSTQVLESLNCVPKNVHLFIFQITLSKISRF